MHERVVNEYEERVAAAMRARFPMLDPFKSFALAQIAVNQLLGGELEAAVERGAREFDPNAFSRASWLSSAERRNACEVARTVLRGVLRPGDEETDDAH